MAYYDALFASPPTGLGARLNRAQVEAHFRRLGVPAGGRVAEVGPGRGEMAQRCLRAGLSYVGLDANPSVCALVREMGGEAVEAFAPPLPLEDGSADAVYANSVVEHMPDHLRALELIQEMARVARPGGRVVVHSPDLLACGIHFWNSEYSHSFPTTRRRLGQLFHDAGLRTLSAEYVAGPFSGLAARLVGGGMGLFPHRLAAALCLGRVSSEQWYKTRTALMRSVLMVGEKRSVNDE